MPRGNLFVLDGPEGAGKTTVWKGLKLALPSDKYFLSREPGGTDFGDKLREMLLNPVFHIELKTEYLLFWAARVEHIVKIIRPALLEGKHVILDRFTSSTFAIQLWGRENYGWLTHFADMSNFVCEDVTPDLYIHLKLSVAEAQLRLQNRSDNNHIDMQPPEFHERVNLGYGKFFENNPHVDVDANKTESEVLDEVKGIILNFRA